MKMFPDPTNGDPTFQGDPTFEVAGGHNSQNCLLLSTSQSPYKCTVLNFEAETVYGLSPLLGRSWAIFGQSLQSLRLFEAIVQFDGKKVKEEGLLAQLWCKGHSAI